MAEGARFLTRLLDAFVDRLEPLVLRVRSKTRRVAVVEPDGIALYEVREGHPVARVEGDAAARSAGGRDGTVELRLPADQILHRTFQVPSAGRAFLAAIVEHRLERLTPWAPDKVLYGFRIVDTAPGDGSITVAFAATSADIAEEPVRRLEALGLAATALGTAADPIERPLGIDLYRGARSAARKNLQRATAGVLVGLAAVLVPACLGSFWFANASDERLRAAEERLAQLRARLPGTAGSRAEQARGRDRALIDSKRPETSLIVLIDSLAAALPSDTALRELDVDGTKVRLVGRSRDAPALISLLEREPALAQVQFAAPVIRDSENLDDFEIVASRVLPGREARNGQR